MIFVEGYIPASIEIVYAYEVNDLCTFSTVLERYLISTV